MVTMAASGDEIDAIWDEFEVWLGQHQPRQLAALNPPASADDLELLEAALGRELPNDLRHSLLRYNGVAEHGLRYFYREYDPCSAATMARTITELRKFAETMDPDYWWKDSYLPFARSISGDYCCIDLDGERADGSGVLLWYHDDAEQPGLAASYTEWLQGAIAEYKQIWDLDRLGPFAGHHTIVEAIDWSPEGSRLLTIGDHCTARLWDADSGRAIADIDDVPARMFAARFSPDGARFAVSGPYLRIFDTDRPHTVAFALPTENGWRSTSIEWFPDGQRIAALTGDSLEIWETRTRSLLATVALDGDDLRGERLMTASPNSEHAILVTTSAIARITLTGSEPSVEQIVAMSGTRGYGFDADWSPDSQQVAVSSRAGVQIFDGRTLQLVDAYSLDRTDGRNILRSVRWSPDGRHLATGGDRCRIWTADTGVVIAELEDEPLSKPYHSITLAWAPTGEKLATGDVAGRLRVWSWGEPENG